MMTLASLVLFAQDLTGQVASPFRTPVGVAFDQGGDLFVADAGRHQVLKVSLGGSVSVIAGTGAQGFGGDGGSATSALLNAPGGVALGADGAVYIADTGNQRVRVVRGGVISTFAGDGTRGYAGDGGVATAAALSWPTGLAVGSDGGLLIADSGNRRVRRVLSGVITAFAGTGVQGFGGDGGAATAAVLDTPDAVTVGGDGRVFIADTRNNRVRVVGLDGMIQTFAGSGAAGFAGDGGAATAGAVSAPGSAAVVPSGGLLIADAGNHRLRMVNAAGMMSTLVGTGAQGTALDAAIALTSPLDTPVAVAVSAAADVVFADAQNGAVFQVAADGTLRLLGVGGAATSVALQPQAGLTYGSGFVTAFLATTGPLAEGSVALLDAGQSVSTGTLSGGSAALSTTLLNAGTHSLSAMYGGDLLHGAATSPVASVAVAPLALTATAAGATVVYGAPLPALTGTVTGVLARDVGAVSATFQSSAVDLSPVGTYPISAALSGAQSGNYTVALSANSGALNIVQAQPLVTLATQGSYAGLPILLSAVVASPTRGVPTGSVQFMDAGVVVATAALVNGAASAAYVSPAAGTHDFAAAYTGDLNFAGASSAVASVVASAMPDFTLAASGSASQTVQGGSTATYTLLVAPQAGPFSGSVSFNAAGAQPGAKVVFSPSAVVPGSGAVPVTMTIQTVALTGFAGRVGETVRLAALLFGLMAVARGRRARVSAACVALMLCGCGTRTAGEVPTVAPQTFNVVVTGTSTNLAGVVVTHTCAVVLTVK